MAAATRYLRSGKVLLIAGLVLSWSWIICYETGKSLPYLQTERSYQLRMYLLFPSLVLLLVWFGFVHRWRGSGKSGYRMAMDKLESRGARLKNTAIGLFGLIAIPAIFSWSSVVYAAWAAYLLSHNPFLEAYRITDVRAVSNYYELDLEGTSNRQQASLPVRKNAFDDGGWRVGDVICARGRSSPLGTIVESISARACGESAT